MTRIIKELGMAILLGIVMPEMLLRIYLPEGPMEPEPIQTEPTRAERIIAYRLKADELAAMGETTYLTGVLLAEMPIYFESEALKAQAIAARTYMEKAIQTGGKHGDGTVCGNYACCQAYIAQEDYLAQGGTEADWEKAYNAVKATDGQILMYEGEPIEAVYFSCSGGCTEDAVSVWGAEYPYLQAVKSPEPEVYSEERRFSGQELETILGVHLPADSSQWFTQETRTVGGGLNTVCIGGLQFGGTELRRRLGLRSTLIAWTLEDNGVTFQTQGYGHRVGMSQYGAEALAISGKSCADILAYYYPGTEIVYIS